MMGRLKIDQGQLFYEFRLGDADRTFTSPKPSILYPERAQSGFHNPQSDARSTR